MPDRPVFRFAPSPNGRLHLGHAYSALTTFALAKKFGGRFLVRIEDIDTGRTREEHVQAILDDLAWLGLSWEEPVLRQSRRFHAYRAAADKLHRAGLAYRCAATRGQINEALGQSTKRDPDGAPLYASVCGWQRTHGTVPPCIKPETIAALRLNSAAAIAATSSALQINVWNPGAGEDAAAVSLRPADPARWGDAVIVRKDTPASYHLACVIDDAFQGVTHVTRGQDLEAATDLHVLLQALLGLPSPLYFHHDLIRDGEGRKLSKSEADTSLGALRAGGATARQVKERLGFTS